MKREVGLPDWCETGGTVSQEQLHSVEKYDYRFDCHLKR